MAQESAGVLKKGAILLGAALFSWLSVSVGAANLMRVSRPTTALSFSAGDSRALSALGDMKLQAGTGPGIPQDAARLGLQSWRRDPTNPVALRLIAAPLSVDRQRRIIGHAERVSKRDIVGQLWLIEDAVQRNEPKQALGHYDVALRTSAASRHILFPILSLATGEAELQGDIANMLARKPDWAVPFLYEAANSAPDSGRLLAIVETLKRNGFAPEPTLASNLLKRVIRDHRYDLAANAYRLAGGRDTNVGRGVVDGEFKSTDQLSPIHWSYASDNGLYAERIQRPSEKGGYAASVKADAGAAGDAIRQMMLLPPGSYEIGWFAGDVPQADTLQMSWTVRCAQSEVLFAAVQIPPAPSSGASGKGRFVIPSVGCAGQWLSLAVRAEAGSDATAPWITRVAVTPTSQN